MSKPKSIYSLDCNYYTREFTSIDALIADVLEIGMDPNYEVTRDGKKTGEILADLIQF